MVRHPCVVEAGDRPRQPKTLGLTLGELWWPAGAAIVLLVINKAVIHDDGSFVGAVLMVGFAMGLLAVHALKAVGRAAARSASH